VQHHWLPMVRVGHQLPERLVVLRSLSQQRRAIPGVATGIHWLRARKRAPECPAPPASMNYTWTLGAGPQFNVRKILSQ
jgi:hypothetical protein